MTEARRWELLGLAGFAALSVAWTWPLALSPASVTVARHFDVYPAVWLAEAARGIVSSGESLQRVDSLLFLLTGLLAGGRVPGLVIVNAFVLLGPVISAAAAQRFAARALGVSGPAAVAAGIAFGFSPLALVAILEGHVYVLLDPWLPLCALAVWEGRARAAAVHFLMALLSTAYLGVATLAVALAVAFVRAPDLGRERLWRTLGALLIAGTLYTGFYLTGDGSPAREGGDADLRAGSASLTTLLAWSPWVDLARHSLGPAMAASTLLLGALGAVRAAREPSRRRLAVGFGAATLLGAVGALGPWLELGVAHTERFPTPLALLAPTGVFDVFRFPIRLAWIPAFCGGALLAGLLTRAPRGAQLAFLGLAAFEVCFVSGAQARVEAHPMPVPRVYGLLPQGIVLDLFPEAGGVQEDLGFLSQNLSCHAQLSHGRPILERCLNTELGRSARVAVSREVHAAALGGGDVRGVLGRQSIASVVVHADRYAAPERAEIVGALTRALGAPVAEGRDGGAWLLAWRTDAR